MTKTRAARAKYKINDIVIINIFGRRIKGIVIEVNKSGDSVMYGVKINRGIKYPYVGEDNTGKFFNIDVKATKKLIS
jgi:hypothetical protein